MEFNFTDRITEAPKYDPQNTPSRPEDWTLPLAFSAAVWLARKLEKPILKLTQADYEANGLKSVTEAFENAYELNIKLFNHLQHTITGWPGGKPNADDTNRPERANP